MRYLDKVAAVVLVVMIVMVVVIHVTVAVVNVVVIVVVMVFVVVVVVVVAPGLVVVVVSFVVIFPEPRHPALQVKSNNEIEQAKIQPQSCRDKLKPQAPINHVQVLFAAGCVFSWGRH